MDPRRRGDLRRDCHAGVGPPAESIYFPFGAVPSPSEVGLADVESVTFETDDGIRLHGWFVPGRRSPAIHHRRVQRQRRQPRVSLPAGAGVSRARVAVLLFDYRGYGGNDRPPTEAGLRYDARAARAFLATRADVDLQLLVYFGESLGAAVAMTLAAEHPPAALVLRSPFTLLADVGRLHYPFLPVRWLLRDRFQNLERIAQIHRSGAGDCRRSRPRRAA